MSRPTQTPTTTDFPLPCPPACLLRAVPCRADRQPTTGVEAVIQYVLSREVQGAVRRLSKSESQIAREARRPMLRLPLEGVAGEELLKQLELLRKQEEAQMKPGGRSLGYAHTHDVGGVLGEHCALLLKAFQVWTTTLEGDAGKGQGCMHACTWLTHLTAVVS